MATTDHVPNETEAWSRRRVLAWGGVIGALALTLHLPAMVWPMLLMDDFQMLALSWTWQDAWANVWTPANEHSMPLGRISNWLLVQLAGRLGNVPLVFSLQGPLALLVGMFLVYVLVRREVGHPFPALLAMALFGVTTRFQEAVFWFAASFSLLALDFVLLTLLAAQRWRQTGRYRHLFLSALGAALAPAWFATGILAGPVGALYLLGPSPGDRGEARREGWRRWLPALAPLMGTAVSLAVTLPHNARQIANLPRVELPATALETFNPLVGLAYTARALVDDLLPGLVGVSGPTCPIPVVAIGWVVLAAAAGWWWRRGEHRRLLLVGLGLILSSYLLIYSGRAYFPYAGMHHSGRYHLFAHLGLTLFICGGPLPGTARATRSRGLGPVALAAALLVLLFFSQLPRWARYHDPQQAADLRRVDQVDARCRAHRIDADTARWVLPPLALTGSFECEVNGHVLSGWYFLRGSDDPRPVPIEEVLFLLTETGE